ncbi:hypothetical protein SAMN05216419_104813 [Nitrosomonas cryotolerans]|uniref:Uncharacterized protein n=1 Tax=Nitrosomonas cryotolerans ATCC 49181 TaxID=1131553 RepID=A0A1N6J9Y3_9PROT|nr:hypothetical protein [Nitrosomonas cryotolerans]SFQ03031.1 hypothetical protein SAMN05216419_104813 [Nitrosomonas cryotolerans]SIO40991.1 hypothetical protein SAMN02743940_2425 [Nitrosomonas cryotolerans ATCC 49181]
MLHLDPEDAALFKIFSQFIWVQGGPLALILDVEDEVYTKQGITSLTLRHLEKIGLVIVDPKGYVKGKFGKHTRLFYNGKPTKIEFPNKANNYLNLGYVLLTDPGKKLVMTCGTSRNQTFYEYVTRQWFEQGLILSSIQLNTCK